MSGLMIPEDTRRRQQIASDPQLSAWVSANAGSGKTYVLSRRVIRLLLAGNDPSSILCLTFTKAAANEMANRVFAELARWTVLEDHELAIVLSELGETKIGPQQLVFARQLFASALETPGGLKVQTIHAFCERLLQQFPFEANVPGHFDVADDETQFALLTRSRSIVFQAAYDAPDGDLGRAFAHLIDAGDDETVDTAIEEILRKRDIFARFVAGREQGVELQIARLRELFGLASHETLETIARDMMEGVLGGFGASELDALVEAAQQSSKKTDLAVADRALAVARASNAEEQIDAWLTLFSTTAGEPRSASRFVTKAVQEDYPDVVNAAFGVLDTGFFEVRNKVNALTTIDNTSALFTLTSAVVEHYLRLKNELGLLDYDDLIAKTERLLSRSEAALWVQYKLDRGLSHILVDEAQDTSPAQWRVVSALSDAFFHDEGSGRIGKGGTRTLFAVGDEKQSIYSFQGAAPDAFDHQRRMFEKQARDAALPWQNVTLNLSFRSADDVLSAVDKVFSSPELAASVSRTGVDPHQAYRAGAAGEVRLWPLFNEEERETSDDWRLPVDRAAGALERLAGRIANEVATAISDGHQLANGEAVKAGDFLVLLKKRGQIMALVNRALKQAGIPVAGMDRLALTDHIAVKDLLCLGEVMLLPENDLALATLLKSPFFDFSDEDLIDLAANRAGSLLEALRGSKIRKCEQAYADLLQWLNRVDFETPYRFYARILAADGGRQKLLSRLGTEAEDMIDEFLSQALEFETATGIKERGIGLQGFIQWMGQQTGSIKRELDASRDEVRVMTVHGAKGLEAPIVYLVDDGSQPQADVHRPKIFTHWPHGAEGEPILFWGARGRKEQTKLQRSLLETSDLDAIAEYRRLLYVGMTRAEDQLVICGRQGRRPISDQNWYRLVETALKPEMRECRSKDDDISHFEWRVTDRTINESVVATINAPDLPARLPYWIDQAPPQPQLQPRQVSPSRLAPDEQQTDDMGWQERLDTLGQQNSAFALVRGQSIHTLLQHLPGLPADAREAAADIYLRNVMAGATPVAVRREIVQKALAVLNNSDFAFLFDGNARAEVSVAGTLSSGDQSYSVSGTIDRLCQWQDGLLIVDFKTNRRVPDAVSQTPTNYINQLAAYRALLRKSYLNQEINAGILWVESGRLDVLEAATLDAAEQKILSM